MENRIHLQSLKAILSYPFKQPEWQTTYLILALLVFGGFIIPVLPWLVVGGYFAAVLRRAAASDDLPEMPDLKDWGALLVDGLRQFGVGFILNLPIGLLYACGFGVYFFSMVGSILASESGSRGGEAFFPLFMMGGMGVWLLALGIALLLTLLIALFFPVISAHVAVKQSFPAMFRVREWARLLRKGIGGYAAAMVVVIGVYGLMLVVSQVTFMIPFLCGLYPFILGARVPWLIGVAGVLFGKAYREANEPVSDPAEE